MGLEVADMSPAGFGEHAVTVVVEVDIAGESDGFEAVAVKVEDDGVAGPDPVLGAVPPVFDVF